MIHEIITDGLNHCPFCGGAAEMKIFDHFIKNGEYSVNVRCMVCGCGTPDFSTGQTFQFAQGEPSTYINLEAIKSRARAAWSKRHNMTELDLYEVCVPYIAGIVTQLQKRTAEQRQEWRRGFLEAAEAAGTGDFARKVDIAIDKYIEKGGEAW